MNRFKLIKVGVVCLFFVFLCANITQGETNDIMISVTPMQIKEEFRINALAMERKYSNKQVKITGFVTEINKDEKGRPFVKLVGPQNYLGFDGPFNIEYSPGIGEEVMCQFAYDQIEELIKITKNQSIIVICTQLTATTKSVVFAGCKLN